MESQADDRKILFISPHLPYPPTEGGMLRTYSLLRCLPLNWEVHYLVLGDGDGSTSKAQLDQLHAAFPRLKLEQYRGPTVSLSSVERFRSQRGLRRAIAFRDYLKRRIRAHAGLWILKLPFQLYFAAKKHISIWRFVRRRLESTSFNAVLLDYTSIAYLTPAIRKYDATTILNLHNAESDLERQIREVYEHGVHRRRAWLRWKLYRFYEKHYVPKFDLVLAPSPTEAAFHRERAGKARTVVCPNGVDTSALTPLGRPEEAASLIFPGRMDYPPNAHAMRFFCRAILPRIAEADPRVRLYIVGKNPPPAVTELRSDRVTVTGYVDDMGPYWRKAAALVAPLSLGSGTRIKIIEAMALGRPVVSTSKGCEGLEVTHGRELLVADDPRAFADAVIRLLRDPEPYREMVLAARRLVEEKYSFGVIGAILRDALKESEQNSGHRRRAGRNAPD